MATDKVSMKCAFSLALVFTNIFWKDGRSGKTGGFCKHKCSSLYNKAVDVIYIVCQEVAVVPDVALTIRIVQASEKASNRKYLLKAAQTV